MTTAVDSNILLDIFKPDPGFGPQSRKSLQRCRGEGRLISCEVVWAEVAAFFRSPDEMRELMERLGVDYVPLESNAALAAGESWKVFRSRGGRRERVVADFLVGAHALFQGDQLLTRDRGFYREYFSELSIIDPTE